METSMTVRFEMLSRAQRAEREALIVADYRRRHPEATAREAIILILADLETSVGRA
jgi:hypothetical protein